MWLAAELFLYCLLSTTSPLPWATSAASQMPAPGAGDAVEALRIDNPEFDFGDVPDDQELRHVFHFTNISNSTVYLDYGCTSGGPMAVSDRECYHPGDSGTLTVYLNPSGRSGPIKRVLTIIPRVCK